MPSVIVYTHELTEQTITLMDAVGKCGVSSQPDPTLLQDSRAGLYFQCPAKCPIRDDKIKARAFLTETVFISSHLLDTDNHGDDLRFTEL